MQLFRLHAYSVVPQRGSGMDSEPEGGAVSINAENGLSFVIPLSEGWKAHANSLPEVPLPSAASTPTALGGPTSPSLPSKRR